MRRVCVCVCIHKRDNAHCICGGGCAAAAAAPCGDLMLMRSVMGVNREREGNRLGLHWKAHSPCALQYTCLFIPSFQ